MIGWENGEFVGIDPHKIIYADLYDDILADIASALDDVHRNHHVSARARIPCVRVQGRPCLNRAGYPEGRAVVFCPGIARYDMSRKGCPQSGLGTPAYRCR